MSEALALAFVNSLDERAIAMLAERLQPYLPAPPQPDAGRWMDTKAAAAYLGVGRAALHKLTAARSIRFEQDGPNAKCWFKRSWLDDFRTGRQTVSGIR